MKLRGSGLNIPLTSLSLRSQTPLPTANSLSENIGARKGGLSSDCRKQFLEECWSFSLSDKDWTIHQSKFDSYFSCYESFCQDPPDALLVCPHEKLCQSVKQLATGTRQDVERRLSQLIPLPTGFSGVDQHVVEFIGLAVLGINLKSWKIDETLHGYIGRTLGVVSVQTDRDRLPLAFNAASFDKKAGIRIRWHHDLTGHLDVVFGESTLNMFDDVALLDLLQQSTFRDVFPPEFIQETRRSIDLMLPMSDPRCRNWLKDQSIRNKIGVSVGRSAFDGIVDRNIYTFDFWRDRLIVAKDIFDNSQPNGLKQLFRDNRDKVKYWTFWIAFVVFCLTLGGFVTSCLQVYKAYHPSPQPPWPGSTAS